jgi:hypothetical protein
MYAMPMLQCAAELSAHSFFFDKKIQGMKKFIVIWRVDPTRFS